MHALRRLGAREARQKLEAYEAHLANTGTATVRLGHCDRLLNTLAPGWWVLAFTDLFYRGDLTERRGVPLRRWLKTLLQRVDFLGWASSREFAAAGFILARRVPREREHRRAFHPQPR